ncbi:MAG TPA: phenylalanine 4-monooxygenase [Pirellulaceae bacterium]|nr:phenylalanine 4-monooxygenase [Pirellulaceae bacterium]HMO91295.1 phenylalanine 4-monooxygenase [Pirellulaceae bacterium]HMP68521.1 phenylalanine 4-monooxygenase [Pirellulaceae bacterium]
MATAEIGLTTTQAPFIEKAQAEGQLFIHQPYELYSEANQDTWRRLYARIRPLWEKYANPMFMQGVENLMLSPHHIPRLEEINKFLEPLTQFKAKAVAGYIPAYIFFDCIRTRNFPTTITIRDGSKLDYLPEPDIFHDIAGHVPMHTEPRFADVLVRFGEVARRAAYRAQNLSVANEKDRLRIVESNIRAMARFFWFTVEFGLMRGGSDLKVYGSGLLSSAGEIAHCIESPIVQRYPIQLEWVINQYFEIDHYQELLFIVESFDHLFDLVDQLEPWIEAGKMDNVALGEPVISQEDLKSFLNAEVDAA